MDFVADTTLLVGLWRRQSWAVNFAQENASRSLGLPWVVLGEFKHGAMRAGHDYTEVEKFLKIGTPMLDPSPAISAYARLCIQLQNDGFYREVGQNDLWIGAAAIAAGRPLLTRNRRHFDKMKELKLFVLEKPAA
jgi:predicted nucleic acid-binding protein